MTVANCATSAGEAAALGPDQIICAAYYQLAFQQQAQGRGEVL
jgi:hypothetical protein